MCGSISLQVECTSSIYKIDESRDVDMARLAKKEGSEHNRIFQSLRTF